MNSDEFQKMGEPCYSDIANDHENVIAQAFDRCIAKAQQARMRQIQETKARQAMRGFLGTSTGDAQLLGKAIIASEGALAKELIGELDGILTIGESDVPSNAAEPLAGRFEKLLELPVKTAEEYLGGSGGMDGIALVRIKVEWGTMRADLAQEFALLMRRHRAHKLTGTGAKEQRGINSQVQPVHFEDYSGKQFERLVFAFALRNDWKKVEWLGEAGGDGGRDIWCSADDGTTTAILCANFKALTFAKAASDLDKLSLLKIKPDKILIVCGGSVSATLREKIEVEAARLRFEDCTVWAGTELEEHIRLRAEVLLKRFCHGEEFPDTPRELSKFASEGTMEHAPTDFDPTHLLDEAKRLLFAMSEAEDGCLLRVTTMDGYSLTIDRREFLPDTTARRVIAKWERTINELLNLGLIESEGSSGEIFVITDAGYQAVEECGLIP